MVQGRDRALPQRQRRIPPAPGPGPVPGARLRALRPRHQHPQRQLDLRRAPTTSGARRRPRSSTRSTTSRSPSSPPARSATAPPTAPSCTARPTGASSSTARSGMIEPRFADGCFPSPLRQPRRRRLRRGQLRSVHLDGSPRPGRPLRAHGRPGEGRRPARPLPAQAQRRRRRHPHRPRPARQRADPARALALRLDCGGPTAPRRRCGARCALYSTAPAGYPGNDDLGTLSAWYVFGALGLYPEVPGVGVLAIGSPLFGHAIVALAARPQARDRRRSGRADTRLPPGSIHQAAALQRPPPTAGPGPPTARSPGAPASPSSSGAAPTAAGAAPPPPRRPPSAPAARCRGIACTP